MIGFASGLIKEHVTLIVLRKLGARRKVNPSAQSGVTESFHLLNFNQQLKINWVKIIFSQWMIMGAISPGEIQG